MPTQKSKYSAFIFVTGKREDEEVAPTAATPQDASPERPPLVVAEMDHSADLNVGVGTG